MWRLLQPGDTIEAFDESYISDDGGLPKWKRSAHHLVGLQYDEFLVPMRRPATGGAVDNSTQQLQAKIAALANEIECRTRDDVSISPSMVVERLRQLSAMQ